MHWCGQGLCVSSSDMASLSYGIPLEQELEGEKKHAFWASFRDRLSLNLVSPDRKLCHHGNMGISFNHGMNGTQLHPIYRPTLMVHTPCWSSWFGGTSPSAVMCLWKHRSSEQSHVYWAGILSKDSGRICMILQLSKELPLVPRFAHLRGSEGALLSGEKWSQASSSYAAFIVIWSTGAWHSLVPYYP